jgi:hypothetical protein
MNLIDSVRNWRRPLSRHPDIRLKEPRITRKNPLSKEKIANRLRN